MAIEDGAVLGTLFSKITSAAQVPAALKIYEELRKPRTTVVINESYNQNVLCKLPDGEQQQERDRKDVPIRLLDPQFQQWLYGFDSVAEAERYVYSSTCPIHVG